jgi:hypothetical protein
MAVTKTVLKKTQTEAVVKVAGTADSATIDLDVDLVAATELAGTAGSQLVNITSLQWAGASGGTITITRNSVVIATLQANAAGELDFGGQMMVPDTVENDQNIVVTISGAQAECWMRLRKAAGYNTKIQPEQYGIYDDQTSISA